VKPAASVAEPPGVVTTTFLAPAVPAGVVKLIDVSLMFTRSVAATPPTVTTVVPVRLVPVKVTVVPPAVVPETGLMAVTVGTAAGATYV
jgi:hypothetical protein